MAKYLSRNVIKGQSGINVVEEAVLGMGFKWSPGNGSLDTGIDGDIELVDPATREAKNVLIRAQVKSRGYFEKESNSTFEFACAKPDIEYWLTGNAPVILIFVRFDTRTAWWKCLRSWFSDPARRKIGRIVFDKAADRFDKHTGPALLDMTQQYGSGVYISPKRKPERLVSNLLEVTRLPARLYMAETQYRDSHDLRDALHRRQEWPPKEWFLRDGRLYSIHDLREEPWKSVCDVGTVESIETEEWSQSDSIEQKNGFVRLLEACLSTRIAPMGLSWNKDEECYYYKARNDKTTGAMIPKEVWYKSLQQRASRIVFQEYRSKKDPTQVAYYRHQGFKSHFIRLDGKWYMEITPRYIFTADGKEPHRFREEYQSKIKTIEGGAAVRGTIVMFASLLQDETGLFAKSYPHLGFGELATTEIGVGIDDELWGKKDELQPSSQTEQEEVDSGLFAP